MAAGRVVVVGVVAHFESRDLLYIEFSSLGELSKRLKRERNALLETILYTLHQDTVRHDLSEDERTALAELKETMFLY